LQEQIAGLTAQQEAKSKEMALIEQELGGVRDLSAKNLVQINRLTSLEREEARLHGERGQLIAGAAEAKGKITETELQILQVDQELSSDVAKEMREIDSKIGEYVERKVTAEDQLKRTDIRAPQDGVVFQSTANTVGGVITAGDPVMLIVPETDTLLVEVKVDPKDIDQVKLGQRVVLRFSAFNQRTTPELNGTVARVAADTTNDQRPPLPPKASAASTRRRARSSPACRATMRSWRKRSRRPAWSSARPARRYRRRARRPRWRCRPASPSRGPIRRRSW
jgi:HlyD family secretion protein